MANLGTKIFTSLFGKKVGEDEFGNKYYQSSKSLGKRVGRYNKERRWVVFKGKAEATKIPAYWHSWVHYSTDDIPTDEDIKKEHKWQSQHTPNLTGTNHAYFPKGHKNNEGIRDKSAGDYVPWNPNK